MYAIPEVLATYIEIYLIFSYFDLLLAPRFSNRKHRVLKQLIVAFLVLAMTFVNYQGVDPYLTVLCFSLLYSGFALIIYDCKIVEVKRYSSLPITIIYYFGIFSCDLISASIVSLLFERTASSALMVGPGLGRIGHLAVLKGLSIAVFLIFKNILMKRLIIKPYYSVYIGLERVFK